MKITSSSSGMGYPGGRNAYANGMGPKGFFGAKLGTGFGQSATGIEPAIRDQLNSPNSAYRSVANFLYSNDVKKFAKGGAIAGGVMAAATLGGIGLMGLDKFFKKQVGIKARQGTGEVLLRGAAGGLAVGAIYGMVVAGTAGYSGIGV